MLYTKDLLLDKAKIDDWYDMYINLWSHDISARYMLWNTTKSEEDAIVRINKTIEHQKRNPYAYNVYEKKSGKAIGFAGMMKIAENVYEDTGIAIGPSFVGKGYGKQILMALVHQAFDELETEKFVASCRSQNIASRQLQLSCGFKYAYSESRVDPRNGNTYTLEFYELRNNHFM